MRQSIILSTLLVSSLAGTYLTMNADPTDSSKADHIAVYRADPTELHEIRWSTNDVDITLEQQEDDAGSYIWVTASTTEDVPVDTTDTGETAAPPETVTTTVTFKGNKAADTAWNDFAPLYALRELSDDTTNPTLGFDDPAATLTITRKSGPLTLTVGGETYGGRDRYVALNDKVFLVDDKTLRPLQYGTTRLMERNIQPLREMDLERVTVTAAGETLTFVQQNMDDRSKRFWSRVEAPTQADEAGTNWLKKMLRMRIQHFPNESEVPAELQKRFSLTTTGDEGSWKIDVFQADHDGTSSYYARSTYTRGLVELTGSTAAEAIADLDGILEGGD